VFQVFKFRFGAERSCYGIAEALRHDSSPESDEESTEREGRECFRSRSDRFRRELGIDHFLDDDPRSFAIVADFSQALMALVSLRF
jgi:hypothetical protein